MQVCAPRSLQSDRQLQRYEPIELTHDGWAGQVLAFSVHSFVSAGKDAWMFRKKMHKTATISFSSTRTRQFYFYYMDKCCYHLKEHLSLCAMLIDLSWPTKWWWKMAKIKDASNCNTVKHRVSPTVTNCLFCVPTMWLEEILVDLVRHDCNLTEYYLRLDPKVLQKPRFTETLWV